MDTQTTVIRFADLGSTLGLRKLGQPIREEILLHLKEGRKLTFDFEGVNLISSSFGDECFGKLLHSIDLESLKENTSFKNTNEVVRMVILLALRQRSSGYQAA